MICQVYPVKTVSEAFALMDAGVDYLGLLPRNPRPNFNISDETALEILEAIGDRAVKVVLPISNDPKEILDTAQTFHPDILHVSGKQFFATAEFAKQLKDLVPGIRLMHSIEVSGEVCLKEVELLQGVADYLLLDSGSPLSKGASGLTHDWNISRKIVELSKIPVVLAGGLGADNVADAVRFVKPWGVDSLTKTSHTLPDGSFVKDIESVRRFCSEARNAEAEYAKAENG